MTKKLFLLTAAIAAFCAAAAACGAKRSQTRRNQPVENSMHPIFLAARNQVFLLMDEAAGPIGTAFLLKYKEKRYLVTNYHVIADLKGIYVQTDGKVAYKGMRVLATDRKNDLAILDTGNVPDSLPGLPWTLDYATSQPIYVVGFPDMRSKEDHINFGAGVVSDANYVAPVYIGEGTDRNLQITAPIAPGHSGSPVLNEGGEAIGVVAWGFGPEADIQAGNYAVPFEYVKKLLAEIEGWPDKDPAKVYPPGAPCKEEADCAYTYLCVDGACRGLKDLGAACKYDRECFLPYICDKSVCSKPGPLMSPCQYDAQCAPPNYCILGACRPLGEKGAACQADIDCAEPLYCIAGKCAADLSGTDGPCAKDSDCVAPLGCIGGLCKEAPVPNNR